MSSRFLYTPTSRKLYRMRSGVLTLKRSASVLMVATLLSGVVAVGVAAFQLGSAQAEASHVRKLQYTCGRAVYVVSYDKSAPFPHAPCDTMEFHSID